PPPLRGKPIREGAGHDQEGEDAAEEIHQAVVRPDGRDGSEWDHDQAPLSATTVPRRRARNCSFASPPSRVVGTPKTIRARSGTGRNSPFGRIRFRFSRYTGTTSSSGRAAQR